MQYDKDMKSEHRGLFLAARKLLLSFDDIVETKKEKITTYSNPKGGICHLRTMPHGIDFGFLKGAEMNDVFGLLSGNGKVMRVLSLKTLDKNVAKYYIEQSIEINARK